MEFGAPRATKDGKRTGSLLNHDSPPGARPNGSLLGRGAQSWAILETMRPPVRRHLASSPFRPEPEPTIEQFLLNDLVTHDSYGMGRVVQLEAAAVWVDFGSQTVRVPSPFHRMTAL